MLKTYGYIRVSSRGQVDGDGPERQELAMRKYAEINKLALGRIHFDDGVSGKLELEHRPALLDLIRGCVPGDTVLIEKLDRLARDIMVQEGIIRVMQNKGIHLVSIAEPDLCTDDPGRVFMRQILGAVAELERKTIVARTRAARDRIRARDGRCEGAKPYGSHPAFPAEREVLAVMRELHAGGRTYHAVSIELNARGLKPRRGPRWHFATVQRILERAA
jgi:DNA invertase Pin-like site-specific DNA recombinase